METLTGVAYGGAIGTAARRHGLDPALLAAVAAQETGGPESSSGRNVVGDHGHGHGLFQIDDRYHSFAKTAAAMDPARNADYAATMISGLLKRYGGDVHKALSAYNAGSPNAMGTVTDWGGGTRLGYADSVLRHYTVLSASAPPETAATGGSGSASTAWQQIATALAGRAQSLFPLNLQSPVLPQPRKPDQNASASPPASSVLQDLSDDS
jgi:hypothetical protein